jgi:hypothetical protein
VLFIWLYIPDIRDVITGTGSNYATSEFGLIRQPFRISMFIFFQDYFRIQVQVLVVLDNRFSTSVIGNGYFFLAAE